MKDFLKKNIWNLYLKIPIVFKGYPHKFLRNRLLTRKIIFGEEINHSLTKFYLKLQC